MVIDSSKFLAEKGKLPSRILLGRHKNWVHFTQLIFCRPSFVRRVLCSIIPSYINKAHLLSQHPHYRHAERRVRLFSRDNQETIILKPTLNLLYTQFKTHWYNWTRLAWRVRATREWIIFSDDYRVARPRLPRKGPSICRDNNQPGIPQHCLGDPGSCEMLSRAHSDNQFQTDIKCGTLWTWPPLASPSQWR